MQKFIAGPTEVSTKMNNYNKVIPTSTFLSGASFTTEDIRQLWGNLWTANPQPNTSAMDDIQYEQSLDVFSKYQNRSLPLHAKFMTAAARNAHNDFIITYATPLFQTAEMNFHSSYTEWNQIEYDDLPEGGIPNETTYTKWGWTDTTRKKKQELRFSVDLANDPIFGMNTFVEHFAQLASTCVLSLYKSTYYSIVHTAYQNKIYDRVNKIPFDISKLYLAETEAFLAFAVDPAQGFKLIRDEIRERSGLDLVLLPEGGSQWIQEGGYTQRNLRSRQLTYNNVTQEFESPIDEPGPLTYRSYQLGDNWLDFMETRSFQVNSLDKRLENPLSTKLTLCQFYPPNSNCKSTDRPKSTSDELNDMWMFYQTKEEGEDRRVAWKDMLRYCGYWDPVTGEISDDVKNLNMSLNMQHATSQNAPWQFAGDSMSNDVNNDIGDYENPSALALAAIGNTTDLTRMKSVRDKFVGSLYNTLTQQYQEAPYIGSNHLDTLPNADLLKACYSLELKFSERHGQSIVVGLEKLYKLLNNLKRAHWTEDYIRGLINANMPANVKGDNLSFYEANGLQEFRANEYGSMRLPDDEVIVRNGILYPAGFQSGPGLLTLRDQKLRVGSPLMHVALEADEAVEFVENLITFIRTYVGKTDIVDPKHAAAWYQFSAKLNNKQSKHAAIATVIDGIWEPARPVFLGIPSVATRGSGASTPVTPLRGGESALLRKSDTTRLIEYLLTLPSLSQANFATFAGSPVITDAIRALSCLSASVGDKYRSKILEQSANRKAQEAKEAYFKAVVSQSLEAPKKGAKTTVNMQLANAITQRFFEILVDESDLSAKSALEYIERVTGNEAGKELKALQETDAYQAKDDSIAAKLTEYEKVLATRPGTVSSVDVTVEARTASSSAESQRLRGKNAAYYDGNYDVEPERYARTPLASSDKLVDFIRTTGFKWAIPADENTMFTTADAKVLDPDYEFEDDESAGSDSDDSATGTTFGLARLSASFAALSQSYSDDSGDNYSYGFQQQQTHGLGAGNLFQFGAPQHLRQQTQRYHVHVPSDKKSKQDFILHQAYPGPFKARLAFYDKIESPLLRIFFLALIQAENTLWTHLKLADVGARLINVLLFRPFIEFYACSIIVMKAGEESGAVPISRFDTYISKEDRGYFHIGCSYYSGFIRLQPANFRMIPYCLPDRFVGGKKTDFMYGRDQWVPHNPLKPSIIALPTPITEITYQSPIHMLNGPTITRPDIDYATFLTKYSSARFFEERFSSENVRHVDELHCERIKYKTPTHASLVAHRGWRAFINPSTGLREEFEGQGPGSQRIMNRSGCQHVWNGKVALFEKDHPTQYVRQRGL